jgi:Cullin protein neddylation domain
MKARKTMKNQPLIQEVISQISQRFTPKIPDIKKVIIFIFCGKVMRVYSICRLSTHCWRRNTLNGWTAQGTHSPMLPERLFLAVSSLVLPHFVAYCTHHSCRRRRSQPERCNQLPYPLLIIDENFPCVVTMCATVLMGISLFPEIRFLSTKRTKPGT